MGKLNGENIAGAGFLFLAFLFLLAGTVNAVFALIYPADYMFIAFGGVLLALGYRSYRSEKLAPSSRLGEPEKQSSYLH